ncbi:entericidin [Croceicoccus gelatinilyticus]|nr:entericidin [Croceicoccus gelatinilyticus]MBS7669160.1 entericidin [Croceicoccus gelatinilyticus]
MKKLLSVMALGTSMIMLSACNTVQGLGEDVESVGECADGVEGNC